MPEQNALDRRKELLADKLRARMDQVKSRIVEPRPYGMVKMSEEDQVRRFLDIRDRGQLPQLRERMGDKEVDQYVREMGARASQWMGAMAERKYNDGKTPSEQELTRGTGDQVASFYTADDDLESF